MVLRQTVWVDSNVQGLLIGRIVLYWVSALLYVTLGSACFQYYQYPNWTLVEHASALFSQFWPWIPSAVLCLPLVVFDVVRLSNLFVGPIYRLRQHLAELCENPHCRALKFRDDDYWQDLAEPIHCLQAEIITLRSEVSKLKRAALLASESSPPDSTSSLDQQAAKLAVLDLSRVNVEQVSQLLPAVAGAIH
jgi:hypothetical protein